MIDVVALKDRRDRLQMMSAGCCRCSHALSSASVYKSAICQERGKEAWFCSSFLHLSSLLYEEYFHSFTSYVLWCSGNGKSNNCSSLASLMRLQTELWYLISNMWVCTLVSYVFPFNNNTTTLLDWDFLLWYRCAFLQKTEF
jgi:hypothetical protein